MDNLRTLLTKTFSEKVYPNSTAPDVVKKIEEGISKFKQRCLHGMFPWQLAGHSFGPTGYGKEYTTKDPSDRSTVVGRFPKFERGDIQNLNTHLREVRLEGRIFAETVNWKRRIQLLLEISKVVKERFWLLCAAKMYETGQSVAEAIGETDEEVDFPLAAAMYLQEIHADLLLPSPAWSGDFNGKRYVPHGTFLNIEPFNFPGAIPMDMAVKALAMGNAVIMKPSDKASLCGYLVYESIVMAFVRLGIPHGGVINYCPGGLEVVNILLESPDIAGVSFTGSSAALDDIKKQHGSILRNRFHGKAPLTFGSAETSGVNVVVVWRDADIPYAASECAKSFLGRQGQKCSSARIIMVHSDVENEFNTALEREIENVRFGSVLEGAHVGPVITRNAEDRIMESIAHLESEGLLSRIYTKRSNISPISYVSRRVLPTILYADRRVPLDSMAMCTLMNTEIFGPVTTVVSFSDLQTVQRLCKLSEFSLTGTSFTADSQLAVELAEIVPAGNLYFNRKCTGALVESECFGGLSSRSSPSGIKGKQALALFGSEQTVSGFYSKDWDKTRRATFIKNMEEERGFVFSKT